MKPIYILSFIFLSFFTLEIFGQNPTRLKNEITILNTLNKYYSSFYLDGKYTSLKNINIRYDIPTRSKNNIKPSDSIFIITISHGNGGDFHGGITIEIDPNKDIYMYSSHYLLKNHGFDSLTLGWWYSITEIAPNYIYSPSKLINMIKNAAKN